MPKNKTTISIRDCSPGALALALSLTGCASDPVSIIPRPLALPTSTSASSGVQSSERKSDQLLVQPLVRTPAPAASSAAGPEPLQTPGVDTVTTSAINLEQIPLPNFAQIAFAEVLKKNVSIDPRVQARRDLVTFRTGGVQTAAQIEMAVKVLLKSYGLSIIDTGGLVRVLPDEAGGATLPEIRRGAATPETPLPLRPIFHLVELNATRPGEVTGWLRTIFGERLKVTEDVGRNALMMSANPDTMAAALEAVRTLDQPAMAGRISIALTPSYWSADDLAKRLLEVLTAEGYAVQPLGVSSAGQRSPIVLLPVTALNSIFVFTSTDELRKHVETWAARLDRPNERGIGTNLFTYAVKHKDATTLAQTLEQLLGGSKPATTAAAGGTSTPASSTRVGSVVVDASTNTLIFQAKAEEYSQLAMLLQTLDKPVKSALIEVTVAELTVDNNSQLGVEWFFNQATAGGSVGTGGTLGGLGIGTGGFNYKVIGSAGGVPRLLLNALASDNKATILSAPRISARNGEQATIQVGQEVPIVTSQATGSATLGVLQTVQYRSTGVILRVKPIIHSGDQIDLDVFQEVSAAQSTTTGVNNSPTIGTRKLETKLSLRNGSTVILGGLISDESSGGNAGIPLLKDIPLVGNLFRTQTTNGKRRELIVLITPYVMNDQYDAEAVTDAFRRQLGPWAAPRSGELKSTGPRD